MKMVTKIFYRLTAQILYKTKHIQQNENWGHRTPNFLWRPFQDRLYNVLKYVHIIIIFIHKMFCACIIKNISYTDGVIDIFRAT